MIRKDKTNFFLILPAILFLTAFLILPLIILLLMAFRSSGNSIVIDDTLTINNFISIFKNQSFYSGILNTLKLSAIVSIVCIVLAYFPALTLVKTKGNTKTLLYVVLLSPMLTSVVIRVYSWIVILSSNGIINQSLMKLHLIKSPLSLMWNSTSLVIAFVQVLLPYAIIFISNSLTKIDNNLFRASNSLGASALYTFFHVILPLTIPGILSSFTLIFSLTAGSYITPMLIAGHQKQVMALTIYQQAMQIMNLPMAAALSVVLLLVVILTIVITNYLGRLWEVRVYGK
ncbi:ABC transporter permease [Loigolactobacillus binensis]|uniref:ABC transporter permease n=1 Tax=Loigolactobacillus binensis TaxID=2559922 RepID=A0ABW3EGW6_9LACO|nr:ABC transporter permease [Loigolactobacillus binensis]